MTSETVMGKDGKPKPKPRKPRLQATMISRKDDHQRHDLHKTVKIDLDDPEVRALVEEARTPPHLVPPSYDDVEILQLLADDYSPARVAQIMGLQQGELTKRLVVVQERYGIRTRAGMVAHALRERWIV